MEFRKRIEIAQSELRIDHQSKMMLFGSCFAENISKLLLENKFQVNANPFGVLYNPASIDQAINILHDERVFSESDIFLHQGTYHSFFHHSSFSEADKSAFIQNINIQREKASTDLKQADTLLVTFGTAYIFEHKATNQVVVNCHKLPPSTFDRQRLTVNEIVDMWSAQIKKLRQMNPALKILFTISPIRHWKDGAHNNQLSKSILLLAVDEITNTFSDTYYFPSYEIVLDELRDYRFYAQDMIHPNDTAIRYIWELFAQTYFDKETIQINKQWQTIYKALAHRPFNEETQEHKQFLRQTLLKINDLQNKFPNFDCEKEILLLTNKLSVK